MSTPEDTGQTGGIPLLVGDQVEAYAFVVRREACNQLISMLRTSGEARAAELVTEDRDLTELTRVFTVAPPIEPVDHAARCSPSECRCGCDRAEDCPECRQCTCWSDRCCTRVAVRLARGAALRDLLGRVELALLADLREAQAEVEEAALRRLVARRTRLFAATGGRAASYAVIEARDSRLGMGHADYRTQNVELHGAHGTVEYLDIDDQALSTALGTLAELLRPEEGADLTVDLGT
ncbi:hypothetical protein [Streptomyces californicus]|uniref:hypothetical protein n=1 Tax=Streptomyces californicus TaxID=67351 RepID=UPI00296ECE25|nr:hypothetical protein [Streptomyces californicus]MDW4912484.1 hypothetical protein [Streptomyces californicus]